MVGIYKIINKINGKIYVGQSVNIEERWKQHEYKAFNANGQAYNSAIHQAFRKYGVENFEYQVVELCSIEELDEISKEKYGEKMEDFLDKNSSRKLTILIPYTLTDQLPNHELKEKGEPMKINYQTMKRQPNHLLF